MDAQLESFYRERNALLHTATPLEIEKFFLGWQEKTEKNKNRTAWISVIHELGLFYRSLGQYDRSIRLLEQAGKAILQQAGRNSLEYVSLLNNLAGTCREAGDKVYAIALLQEAIQIYQKQKQIRLGVCANLYSNLSQCCQENGEWERAAENLEKSLEFLQLSGRKAELGMGCHNLALLYRKMGEKEKMDQYVEKALAQFDSCRDLGNPRIPLALNSLGGILYQEGKYHRAAQVYDRAAQYIQREEGKNHAYAVNRQHEAWALRGEGKLREACRALQEAEEICEGLYGRKNERVQAVLDELQQLQHLLDRGQEG